MSQQYILLYKIVEFPGNVCIEFFLKITVEQSFVLATWLLYMFRIRVLMYETLE